ncbi:MAG: hypothetical protein ABIU05_24400 [Nitrospirales bacterium]
MTRLLPAGLQAVLLLGILVKVGCHGTSPLINLHDSAPSPVPQVMVAQYDRQAVFMVNNAQDVNLRAKRYARLFGPEPKWVTSAKFLEKYYEKESLEQERLAILHAELSKPHFHSASLEVR